MRGMVAVGLGVLLLLLLMVLLLPWRRGYEAFMVLEDIAAAGAPSRLKSATSEPGKFLAGFEVDGRPYRADLYLGQETPLAGLLLMPGAAEGGKDDPRLVAFALTLARARFAVMIPDLPGLRALQVSTANVSELEAALQSLSALPAIEGRPLGALAFSYAAGPLIIAAMEPPLRDRISFILAVGGYHDLERVLMFFTTGYYQQGGLWRHREPNEYGKWVFVAGNSGLLDEPGDRWRLYEMAVRKMDELGASVEDLVGGLGPDGLAVYRFVVNRDRELAEGLLKALPGVVRREIDGLNLARRDLSALRARLILVHGPEDPIIPYEESLSLAQALPPGQARVFLPPVLDHVDVQPSLKGVWPLWRAIDALLAERER